MADEQAAVWFVTEVETSETVEVIEGGRGSEGSWGRFRRRRRPGGSQEPDPAGPDQRRRAEAADR